MKFLLLLVLAFVMAVLFLYLRGGRGGGGGGGYRPPRRPYPGGPVKEQERDKDTVDVDAIGSSKA